MSRDVTQLVVDAERLLMVLGDATLQPFVIGSDGVCDPLKLMDWNRQAAGAVLETLAMVELVVRQAMNSVLTEWAVERAPKHWLQIVDLDLQMRQTVQRAVKTAYGSRSKDNMELVPYHLPFGFWRYLISPRRHAALWVPALHKAFPYGNTDLVHRRQEAARDMETLVRLRNRVAHHDPIFRRDLLMDYQVALRLCRSIDPVAGDWIKRNSRLPELANSNPLVRKL